MADTSFVCQVGIKKILYSQAIQIQNKQKQEREKEERRLKAERKKQQQEKSIADAGMVVKPKSTRGVKKELDDNDGSTEEDLNLAELPAFHRLTDLDEEEVFTPSRQPFESNEHFRIFDGYYQLVNDQFAAAFTVLEARFKGTIPFENAEYLYILKVTKCTDYKGEFLRIDKILAMSRNDLTNDMLVSIFKQDLNQDKQKALRILGDSKKLNSGGKIEYKHFCDIVETKWLLTLQGNFSCWYHFVH